MAEKYEKISDAMLRYEKEETVKAVKDALLAGGDPKEIFEHMATTMGEIGRRFGAMECFLPEVMLVTEAMKEAYALLEPAMLERGEAIEKVGTVVIGCVKGDIHTVGWNMVASALATAGFDVISLGVEIPPSAFLEAAEKNNASIIAASATMTSTVPVQKDLIDFVTASGKRDKYKIMVGGGVTSQEWANKIGADGWARDAIMAVDMALELVGKQAKAQT